jgi:hypothetical protein
MRVSSSAPRYAELAGAAAERWGASPVLGAGGAVCALFALGVSLARPRLRRLS